MQFKGSYQRKASSRLPITLSQKNLDASLAGRRKVSGYHDALCACSPTVLLVKRDERKEPVTDDKPIVSNDDVKAIFAKGLATDLASP